MQLRSELEAVEKTIGERYHTGVEDKAVPILELLRTEDATFYDEISRASDFIHFLTLQYFRTARMRNATTRIPLKVPWNPHRTWPIESFIYATNVGASLFGDAASAANGFLTTWLMRAGHCARRRSAWSDYIRFVHELRCLFLKRPPDTAYAAEDIRRVSLWVYQARIGRCRRRPCNYLLYVCADSFFFTVTLDRA